MSGYAFTLNNYTSAQVAQLKNLDFKYLVLGYEIAPTTETPHIQGYVYFNKTTRFSVKLKTMFPWHIEPAKASAEQNREYCIKCRDYEEFGELPKQGKRNDILLVKQLLLEQAPLSNIVQQVTSYQALKFAETAIKYTEEPRTDKPFVLWYYGPSGSGKSRKAAQDFPKAYWATTLPWYDGYDSHHAIIYDDFRINDIKFNELLRLMDGYPMRIQFKGGTRQFVSKVIIFTSPFPPERYVPQGEEPKQLLRRINFTRKFFLLDTNGIPQEEDDNETQVFQEPN